MEFSHHPDRATLAAIAAGDPEAARAAAEHLATCERCAAHLTELRCVLDVTAEELLELRPDCLSPEELASFPRGSEGEHPHVRDCPLCREEIRLLYEFETQERLGIALGEASFVQPEILEGGGIGAYMRFDKPLDLEIRPEAGAEGTLAGASVRLRVEDDTLVVEVVEEPERTLILLLSNEFVEKRYPLAIGVSRFAVGRWQRAQVEAEAGGLSTPRSTS